MKSNDPTTVVDPAERDALMACLDQVRKTGLTIAYGPRGRGQTIRQQLQITPLEHKAIQLMKYAASLSVGRQVSGVLVMRVALDHLLKVCTKALKDPVASERLKLDVLHARKTRLSEIASNKAAD